MGNNRKVSFSILIGLFFLNIVAFSAVLELRKYNTEVVFFDVGQGDSILVKNKNQQILIDGGPDNAVLRKLAKQLPFWDRTIDLVILTHSDKDHLFGLIEVLKRYKVDNIVWTGALTDTPYFKEWFSLIKQEGADIRIAKQGDKIMLSKDVFFNILFPLESLEGKEVKNNNNSSLVLKLFMGKTFLFLGDISSSIEKDLKDIDSDVLKVAHHGSKDSTSEDFLKGVSPDIAVISVGKNNYGHPSQEVLARLESFGINVLRTDKLKDIIIK